MGLLSRILGSPGATSTSGSVRSVDATLPDAEWFSASTRLFESTVGQHYGSPDTMAAPGKEHYNNQNFGVAMLFFGKAIDMLQTAYCYSEMQQRQPSPADAWIINGYVSAIGASLSMHAQAAVGESARYTANMLKSIADACDRVGAPSTLYRDAGDAITWEARAHLS